jgi:hypothetical protein
LFSSGRSAATHGVPFRLYFFFGCDQLYWVVGMDHGIFADRFDRPAEMSGVINLEKLRLMLAFD